MTIARRTMLLALLACTAPARAQPQTSNLPGSEPAAPPLDIAAQNRAAAALRDRYQQDRAAYEAARRTHASGANDPAAYAETLDAYRARLAPGTPPAASTAVSASPGLTVTGTRGRICYTVGGRADTGSLIARTPARRRCTGSEEERRELASSQAAAERDAIEFMRPKDGHLTTAPPGTAP